ncbi:MAG: FtsX-like permease family protein [Oscillospiraceae bacterium]|nr:FtsX-like permease family protein [Oscillospiraceae bacterium]
MKVKSALKLSLFNLLRSKSRNITIAVMASVLLSAQIFAMQFFVTVSNINNASVYPVSKKSLYVTQNKIQNQSSAEELLAYLEGLDYVEEVSRLIPPVSVRQPSSELFDSADFLLKSAPLPELPAAYIGSVIGGRGEVLLPDRLRLPSGDEVRITEGDELIGRPVTFQYFDSAGAKREYTCEIAGIYKTPFFQETNYAYVQPEDLEAIDGELYEEDLQGSASYTVVLDDAEHLEQVSEEIEKVYGLKTQPAYGEGKDASKVYGMISSICVWIAGLMSVSIAVLLLIILINKINNEKKQIALLKMIGYKARHIYAILFFELLIILLVSYLVSAALSGIAYVYFVTPLVSQQEMTVVVESQMTANVPSVPFYTLAGIFVLPALLCGLVMAKIRRISPIALFKS